MPASAVKGSLTLDWFADYKDASETAMKKHWARHAHHEVSGLVVTPGLRQTLVERRAHPEGSAHMAHAHGPATEAGARSRLIEVGHGHACHAERGAIVLDRMRVGVLERRPLLLGTARRGAGLERTAAALEHESRE